jgi:hypothetical protein
MPTSGTYLWSPSLAECVDDAYERAGVDPSTLDMSHIMSAKRSINFLFVDWATKDVQDFRIDRIEINAVQSQGQYVIDPDADGRVIDILQMSIRRAGSDTTIYPMSRQEWLDIPDKDLEGRPSRYFADKRQDQVLVDFWTVPENSTDIFIMDVARKYQDAGDSGALDPDIPYYMRDAFTYSLAARLALKYNEQKFDKLQILADNSFLQANGSQRERGDVVIIPGSAHLRRSGARRR